MKFTKSQRKLLLRQANEEIRSWEEAIYWEKDEKLIKSYSDILEDWKEIKDKLENLCKCGGCLRGCHNR